MRKIIMVLGVVALLAVAAVSFGIINADSDDQEQLTLDALVDVVTPADPTALPKGATYYAALDLFGEGDAGGTVIGKLDSMTMSTAPADVLEGMSLSVYKIDGEGEIYVAFGPGNAFIEGTPGAITGGTGKYRSATGEALLTVVGGVIRTAFTLNDSDSDDHDSDSDDLEQLRVVGLGVGQSPPGDATVFPKAAMFYLEVNLFEEDDAGGTVIGRTDYLTMRTAPPGVVEGMGLAVFKFDGEGEIHVTFGPGNAFVEEQVGAIIGGTGRYRGVMGELGQLIVGAEIRYSFTFNGELDD